MKNLQIKLFRFLAFLSLAFLIVGCNEEDELPFEVFESPVLAQFEGQVFAPTDNITVTATFYDLDKSGILDQTVGIDSVEIANLSVQVFIDETIEVATLTTDASGKVTFDQPWSSVGGAGSIRLEWVGTYDNRTFRIYHNITTDE